MTTIENQPVQTDPDLDGDHERLTHIIIPASAATEAMVTGQPVIACCGKVWIPSRDPDLFDVCQTCIEVFEMSFARRWDGSQ